MMRAPTPASRPKRPRIALLTNLPNWAFANIARQLERHLSGEFEFRILPLVTLGEIERQRWQQRGQTGHYADGGASGFGIGLVAAEDCDVIHVFWRDLLTLVDHPNWPLIDDYAGRLGMTPQEFRARFVDRKIISFGVYDHLFLEGDEFASRARIFNEMASAYYVCSERLRTIYESKHTIPEPTAVLTDGVDLDQFRPCNLERFKTIAGRPLVVGWVGNSGWFSEIEDFKGVETILIPAIEALQRDGVAVEMLFADAKHAQIPHDQMCDYYARIDVLVCTSKCEGTPNPILEAMACGVPVITTDVGVVPEAFGALQKAYVLKERSIEAVRDALLALIRRPEALPSLSAENLDSIKSWDWRVKARAFGDFFRGLVRLGELEAGELPTKMCMLPFTSPSMETDGSIRLCSATSIFGYRAETNMGNCRTDGLHAVWTGERYQRIRSTLMTGQDLQPYCAACDYRFDGPAWLFQYHLALHAYHKQVRSPEILALIGRWMGRHDEYRSRVWGLGLGEYHLGEDLIADARAAFDTRIRHRRAVVRSDFAPAELVVADRTPIYMDFNTLNRCNVTCVMCPPALLYDRAGEKRPPYYRLTLDEFRKIVDGVRVESVHFVGAYAEPLLNKEIFALVSHAKSIGSTAAITTNASVMSRVFAIKLLDAGIDLINVSLHGATKAVAEEVMAKSDFDRIVGNVRGLQELKRERGQDKPEVYLHFVAQKSNIADIGRFIDLAADLSVKHVYLIHLIDGGDHVDKQENLVHHPELLRSNVADARRRATQHGIHLHVSAAYEAVISAAPAVAAAE